jgi:hypothetical protein
MRMLLGASIWVIKMVFGMLSWVLSAMFGGGAKRMSGAVMVDRKVHRPRR